MFSRAAEQSEGDKAVGVDPTVITARKNTQIFRGFGLYFFLVWLADARKLAEKIKKKGGSGLVGVQVNLIDAIWGKERPPRPNEQIKPLGLEFAGKKFQEKIEELRKELDKKKSPGFIVCTYFVMIICFLKLC